MCLGASVRQLNLPPDRRLTSCQAPSDSARDRHLTRLHDQTLHPTLYTRVLSPTSLCRDGPGEGSGCRSDDPRPDLVSHPGLRCVSPGGRQGRSGRETTRPPKQKDPLVSIHSYKDRVGPPGWEGRHRPSSRVLLKRQDRHVPVCGPVAHGRCP